MSKPVKPAADSTVVTAAALMFGAWQELTVANLVEQAAAVERSLSELLRSCLPGRLLAWDRDTAIIVRPETPVGRIEVLTMTPLD